MTTIANAYINALLADAAYVNLVEGSLDLIANKTELDKRLTQTQADYLAANFEVASIANYSDIPLIGSGFDATVWRGKEGTEFAGQTFVSMRGTQPEDGGADLLADVVDVATSSGAKHQIADMINWWLQITAPATATTVQQIQYDAVVNVDPVTGVVTTDQSFSLAAPIARTGTPLNLSGAVTINGHSLGGHLATAFARIFGGSIAISGISTFNSAGFNTQSAKTMFAEIQNLLGTGLATYSSNQTNYYANNGINFTTNEWWFAQQGQRVALYQEEGTGTANHSMYKQTDLLALGAALEKLDSTFTIDKLNALVKAGSNDMAGSYEGVLDGLRRALLAPGLGSIPVGDVSDSAGSRVTYYEVLKQLTDSATFQSLLGKVRITAVGSNIGPQAQARVDFQSFVALQTLSPFVVNPVGTEGQAALYALWVSTAWSESYQAWVADKASINAGGKATNFTDSYLSDRATMLGKLTERNTADNQGNLSGSSNIRYFDKTSNTQILVGSGSEQRQQFIFGSDGDDDETVLSGQGYADHLYGGAGADTYTFTGTWGKDTIVDSDRQSGNLGLSMDDTPAPVIPKPGALFFNGDQRAPLHASGNYKWSTTSWSADGTLNGGVAEADFSDVITGTSGVDKISGMGGNDYGGAKFTMNLIASSAYSAGARGRFGIKVKAVNDSNWRAVA